MSNHYVKITSTRIQRFLKEGRGKGEKGSYKPWLTVRDVPSRGTSSRDNGWKTGRTHHLLSGHELSTFYCLCWSRRITDIREQFPLLPLEETLALAKECGVKHPAHPVTKEPVVLTTDFLITLDREGGDSEEARTVKEAHDLSSQRVLEKLEIERRYWEVRNIAWGIITEREIPGVVAENVKNLYEARSLPSYTTLHQQELDDIAHVLTRLVTETQQPLRHATSACDHKLGFEPGTSLQVAYYLLATRQWLVDMFTTIDPAKPLTLLGVALGKPC